MADELPILEGLGLSPNEAKLYLILARGGRMKANELALKTNLQRRTVYDTLAQLEKKGMVGKAQVGGVLTFTPSPPSSLLMFLDEKRDSVEKILPLLSRSFEAQEKTSVSVLYGKAGIKMVLEDVLAQRQEFYVYHGQLQFFEYMPKFFRLFNDKRKHLGIRTKYLLLDVPYAREFAPQMPLAEIKFIDPSSLSAGVYWTYADRLVLFVLQGDESVTIFIKNSELARAFKKNFEKIFEATPSAKPTKKKK
ncbi:Sugar-specific transcriptional regulator TrmB [Candidatus Anstonella stagnisolia]|nr:Sugar-specific transcriptional regulator TrmB [Candidatus Anstonella stagnisolia]